MQWLNKFKEAEDQICLFQEYLETPRRAMLHGTYVGRSA